MRILPGDFADESMPAVAESFAAVMTSDFDCDDCGHTTPSDRRHVVRVPRPSDRHDWCGIMWFCPRCAEGTGAKTEAEWDRWIESDEARDQGAWYLS